MAPFLGYPASGAHLSPAIERLLHEAAAAHGQSARAEAILWTAQAIDPDCLPVYFALYKFYFHKKQLERAGQVVLRALQAAARAGGFDADWRLARADSADWHAHAGPAHFYLFSLKALAFICLRRGHVDDSRAILVKLAELDPGDSVGAAVIADLLRGSAC